MLRSGIHRLCIARLTSPEFHRAVSPTIIRTEIQRFTNNPTTSDTEMEIAIVVKHALSMGQDSICVLPDILQLSQEKFSDKMDAESIIDTLLSDSGSIVQAFENGKCIEGLLALTRKSSDDQFFRFLDLINIFFKELNLKKIKKSPPSLLRLIPDIESEIIRRKLSDDATKISNVINAVGSLKLSNDRIFVKVISAIESSSCPVTDLLRPSTALHLLRELGWSGLTDSGLLARLGPVFKTFFNYQALTSVFMIAGGLPRSVVDVCMETIRKDQARGRKAKYPVTVEGHCQMIRRLVACGYFSEAMELFDHFPQSAYQQVTDPKCVSQIHRLFLASFVKPEIVTPERVRFLREISENVESSTVTYSDEARAVETSSFIHNLLVTTLSRLGVEVVSEYIDPESLVMIDVFVPSLNLAIEVQGPSHYITDLKTGERRLRIEDEFKLDVIRARGYHLEQVSVYDFGRNNATRNADRAISQVLAKYSVS